MSLELVVYDPSNTSELGALPHSFARTFTDELRGHGSGQFALRLDAPEIDLVRPWRVVRCRPYGNDRFAWAIGPRPRTEADPTGQPPALIAEGQGLSGAFLGSNLGGALVYPQALNVRSDVTHRYFGWADRWYSPSAGDGWSSPNQSHSAGRQARPTALLPKLADEPRDWPDGRAEWIMPGPLTQGGGGAFHPGTNEFLLRRVLPDTYTGPARVYVAGTNEWELYFDGDVRMTGGGFRSVGEVDVRFEGREHPIALHVSHRRNPTFTWDACAAVLTVVELDSHGRPGRVLFRTYTPGGQGDVSLTQHWRINPNPDPLPGVGAGRVMQRLFDEMKDRGARTWLTRDFDQNEDSSGQPWEERLNVGFPVGAKLGDVLEELGQYGVEWDLTTGNVLRLWNRRGGPGLKSLTPYAEASASGEPPRATRLLGQLQTGHVDLGFSGPEATHGRIEDFVALGQQASRAAARDVLRRILSIVAYERDAHEYVLSGNSAVPYADLNLGDEYPEGRVTAITALQDDASGRLSWAVTVEPEEAP